MPKRKKQAEEKKRKGAGRPKTRVGIPTTIWIEPDNFLNLDAFKSTSRFKPTKHTIVNEALREFFARENEKGTFTPKAEPPKSIDGE